MTEITDGSDVTTYSYDLAGNRTQLSLPNGVTSKYTYDDLSRVASQTTTNGNGTTVYDVSYSYDLVGNRVQVVEDVDGHSQRTIDYSYDGQYRLTEESWDSGNEKYEYEYDSIGNRLSKTVTENGSTPVETQYSYDKLNRLTQSIEDADDDGSFETNGDDNVTNYTYDLNGNRTEKDVVGGQTTTYSFDVHDRLTSASINSNTVFEADYDSRTRRIEKRSIGDGSPGDPLETTVYRYDGGTSFHELDGSGNMQVEFVRGSGQGGGIGSILYADRDAYSGSGPVEHYTFNAVGHTVALTDDTGSVTSTNLYEAFGDIIASTGSSDNDKLANTKERDFSIDLDNHGFRYYDPATGRYITRDPAGEPDGPNNFLYVGNNPINHIDPQGLSEDDFTEDDLEPARAIQETLQATKSETSLVGDFQEGAQLKPDAEPYPVKTCMNCHGDLELLSGKKPVSELNRSQRATFLSWRSGNTSDFAGYVSEGAANTDLDNIQLALDAMGMTPGLGIIADGLNTGISLARGHYGEAMFNAAAMVPIVGQLSNVGKYGVKYGDEAVGYADEATEGFNRWKKSLASQDQVDQPGHIFAGPGSKETFRDAGDKAQRYGGSVSDWVKKRSDSYTAPDGTKFQTHWVENIKTGQRYEHKTKPSNLNR